MVALGITSLGFELARLSQVELLPGLAECTIGKVKLAGRQESAFCLSILYVRLLLLTN